MNTEQERGHTVRRWLSMTCDLKHKRVHALLDELGLYPGQTFVLYALWDQDGLTLSEMTQRLDRSPSTTTKKIQRMERAGFVVRRPDDSDERVTRIFLTDRGRAIRAAVEEMWQRLDRQIVVGFGEQEMEQLSTFLARVCRNLGANTQPDGKEKG